MVNWDEIYKEVATFTQNPADLVKRKYFGELYNHTKRETILYATNWTQQKNISPNLVSISEEDILAFMEAASDLPGKNLDLIIHSPGGAIEPTEHIIRYLRNQFENIRVIIPFGAMSAATILSCCADEILMGKQSFLGPTDPQFILSVAGTLQSVPAQAIMDQFQQAKTECAKDKSNFNVWLPILQQYGPALLKQCENSIELSKSVVGEQLEKNMFKSERDPKSIAKKIASELSNHANFKTHGRHITREKARSYGLKIKNLEDDKKLNDCVMGIFYASSILFDTTQIVKVTQNQNSIGLFKSSASQK
jgi:hypothetical protein